MLFRNNDGLSRNERRAFKMLADTLIFNEPLEYSLSKKNIPLISQKLRNEMIDLDTRSQRKMGLKVDSIFKNITISAENITEAEWSPRTLNKTDNELNMFLAGIASTVRCSDYSFLIGFTDSYANMHPIYQQYMYDQWGFTPRLAELPRKNDDDFLSPVAIRKNCFGTTLGLGSYFGLRGLKFEIAITADHPYVIVYLEKATYAVSFGAPKKLHNKIVDCDGYKTYRPHPKDGLPHTFMVIHDFDKGVLYECLENMEMLRLLSYGTDMTRLPDSFETGFEIADAYKGVLQQMNWKILATKLFPEITHSLLENKEDWQYEIDQIFPVRQNHHAQNVYYKAAKEAQKETMFKNSNFEIGHQLLRDEFVFYRAEIINYLRNEIPFSDLCRTDNVRRYFPVIKEHLQKEKPEIREICVDLLEKNLNKKPKTKKPDYDKVRKHLAIHILRTQNSRGKENRRRKTSSPPLF